MAEIDTSMYNIKPADPMAQVKQAIDLRSAQTQNATQQMQLAIGKQQYISGVFGSLYGKPDLSSKDVIDESTKAVKLGILDPQTVATELSNMPRDANQLRQWVGTHALRTGSLAEQLAAHAGVQFSVDNGASVQQFNRNPMTGAVAPAGGMSNVPAQMSPGEAASQVPGPPDASGRPTVIPKGVYAAQTGMQPPAPGFNKLMGPGQAGQDMNPIMGQPIDPLGEAAGVVPVQPAPQGQQTAQAAPMAAPMAVGNAPGFDKDIEAQQADLANAGQITQRVTPLTNALSKVRELGDSDTGPMAGDINKWKTILNETGLATKLGIDMNGVTNFQQLDKYLKQYGTKAGNGSDKQLEAALGSNPNTSTTKQATEALIISQVAQERIAAAKSLAFEMNGGKKGEYLSTSAKFSQEQDPRAYAFDLMTPEQQAKVIEDVKKGGSAQIRKFKKSLAVYDQLSQQLGGADASP